MKKYFIKNKKFSNRSQLKKGFTLIEILVSVFILALVLVTANQVGQFLLKKNRYDKLAQLSDSVRTAYMNINQKMTLANAKVTLGGQTIYGFGKINDILVIANNNNGVKTCFYIGKNGSSLGYTQDNCTGVPQTNQLNSSLVTSIANVTGFSVNIENRIANPASPDGIPLARVSINAVHAQDSEAKIDFSTSYSLDYQTLKYFRENP